MMKCAIIHLTHSFIHSFTHSQFPMMVPSTTPMRNETNHPRPNQIHGIHAQNPQLHGQKPKRQKLQGHQRRTRRDRRLQGRDVHVPQIRQHFPLERMSLHDARGDDAGPDEDAVEEDGVGDDVGEGGEGGGDGEEGFEEVVAVVHEGGGDEYAFEGAGEGAAEVVGSSDGEGVVFSFRWLLEGRSTCSRGGGYESRCAIGRIWDDVVVIAPFRSGG
mmetsp:Transcript_11374/g.23303  ORF Transcript_11374/g.23303 Transcript_11374/m.23303 type:complete len:216 (+) Transcript_11374:53-700(+)